MWHHIFPYEPSHLGLTPEAWVSAQLGKWPLASVKLAIRAPAVVHFFSQRKFETNVDGLQFIGHRTRSSGPRWRDWGDDWSAEFERRVQDLPSTDSCIIHLDTYPAAIRTQALVQNLHTSIVLHGRGVPTDHVLACDGIVALREDVAKQLLVRGYPTGSLFLTKPSIDKQLFCHRRPAPAPPLRLGFIGTISHSKGISELLALARRLRELQCDFTLDVVGTGQAASLADFNCDIAAAGVTENVKLMGHRSPAEVATLVKSWHVMLHPSHTEGMPIVVLEALSTGCPIVGVCGVFPEEMEKQSGIITFTRERYVESFIAGLTTINEIKCNTDFAIDHSVGAELWPKLAATPQRGQRIPPPSRVARAWRLKPLREAIRNQTALRSVVRRVRHRLGSWGGL